MSGLSSSLLAPLSEIDHLWQSVRCILATRVGTRVMRRDFGSRIPELVDRPMNRSTVLDIYAATAEAVLRWEDRIQPTSVAVTSVEPGRITISLAGIHLPSGREVTLDGLVVD